MYFCILQSNLGVVPLFQFVFCNCPVTSLSTKEQGPRRPVYYIYDFAAGTSRQVAQMVDDMLQDWNTMGHLYRIVLEFSNCLKYGLCLNCLL